MTRTELLKLMEDRAACYAAECYVRNHASDDAAEIGGTCASFDWLIWLLARERRLARFVRVCAKRAEKHAPGSVYAQRAAHYAAAAASLLPSIGPAGKFIAFAAAADYAAYADYDAAVAAYAAVAAVAAYAAAAYDAERAAQLKELQRIWRDWCNGKEAEK